jgi:predicted RNase H-like HicB family nuclease
MIQDHSRYTYHVTWSKEDGEYIGLCTEFPSLSWLDETPETAFSGIRQVVDEAIADMQKNSESIPEPIATQSYSGQFIVHVPPETHRNLVIQAVKSGSV